VLAAYYRPIDCDSISNIAIASYGNFGGGSQNIFATTSDTGTFKAYDTTAGFCGAIQTTASYSPPTGTTLPVGATPDLIIVTQAWQSSDFQTQL